MTMLEKKLEKELKEDRDFEDKQRRSIENIFRSYPRLADKDIPEEKKKLIRQRVAHILLLESGEWDGSKWDKERQVFTRGGRGSSLPRNSNVFDPLFLMRNEKSFVGPRGHRSLAVLVMCYKQECLEDDLRKFSGQSAGVARSLREMGFIFKKPSDSKNYEYRNKDRERCRKITGGAEVKMDASDGTIRLSKRAGRKLYSGRCDPITGCADPKKLIPDHRVPIERSKMEHDAPAELDDGMVDDGSWERDFQITSESTNALKSRACEECRVSGAIRLPPMVSNWIFADTYDETEKCKGCFWHDILRGREVMDAIKEGGELKDILTENEKGIYSKRTGRRLS
jgi:hypothetical protein